jgi:PKD repeat protein
LFNRRPVAKLSADPSVLFCGGAVVFDASRSQDPEGRLAHCHWNFGDDFNLIESREMKTVHTYARAGQFRASVSVEDAQGAISEPAFTTVVVVPRPASDVPSAWTFSDITFSVDTTALAGVPVNFRWAFSDGSPPASGPSVSRRFADNGTVEVSLEAAYRGQTARSPLLVYVLNRAPSAALSITPAGEHFVRQELHFDGSGSTDPDGNIARWWWDPGDGSPGVTGGSVLVHSYAAPGYYTVELEITDNDGATANTTVDLSVIRDLAITGFNASVYRDEGGAARANLTVNFSNYGDAKPARTVKVTVTACAPDRTAIPPANESCKTELYPDPINSGTWDLPITVRELLVYDPSPEHTNYYIELYYLDAIVDKGWYPR